MTGQQLGEAIENLMQLLGRERVGKRLRRLPRRSGERCFGKGKADAGRGKLPAPASHVRCNRTAAGRNTRSAREVTQADLVIDE